MRQEALPIPERSFLVNNLRNRVHAHVPRQAIDSIGTHVLIVLYGVPSPCQVAIRILFSQGRRPPGGALMLMPLPRIRP